MVEQEAVLIMETIFVSIAAMDDSEVVPTVKNCFDAATHPERVVVGVGLAALEPSIYNELKEFYGDDPRLRITYEEIQRNDLEPLGVGKGRWRAARLYEDEDYMLQIDCHTHLAQGWDVDMIDLYKGAKEASGNPKTIMTTYVGLFKYHPERKPREGKERNAYPFYLPNELWLYAVPRWGDFPLNELWPGKYPNKYYPNVKFNPACAFGDREWAKDTGVDPDATFYDEDLIYSISLFGRGFSFVYPNCDVFPITHLNADDINEYGGKRMFFTDYVTPELNDQITSRLQAHYTKFINDPENADAIHAYEVYTRTNVRFGAISPFYMPKDYR
jgi:hypothetical protein